MTNRISELTELQGPPEPPEPPYPADRKSHYQRVKDIVSLCPVGKVAGVAVDDTPEHRAYYLYQLGKHCEISILSQGVLAAGIYLIKVTKTAIN